MKTTPVAIAIVTSLASLAAAAPPSHPVAPGVTTPRPIPGHPYALAGNRVYFTNWYYVQPGDLDWRDTHDQHIDLDANVPVTTARHVGINAPHGIRLAAEHAAVLAPLDLPNRCLIRDGDVYKAWTNDSYFESADAIHWTHKAAVVFDAPAGSGADGPEHVFIDPTAPPAERFKTVWPGTLTRQQFDDFRKKRPDGWEPRALIHYDHNDVACLRGSVSPDGIHWTTLPDPLVVEYSDTLTTCYYDPALRKYVLYTRYWSIGPRAESTLRDNDPTWTGAGRRAIGRSESADFASFPPSEMILEPTPDMLPSEQLYTNCHTTFPGAPDQHLLFPTIWNASINDTTRITMLSSHDGKIFHYVPGGDLIATQPFGNWNGGCVWTTPNLVELPNGDFALPYLAHNVPHKYPRGQRVGQTSFAIWPKGRLCSVTAEDDGEFTLMPLLAPGRTLKINATTPRTGSVTVEVLGVNGRSLADCTSVTGDQAWTTVTWKSAKDLGVDPGKPVTLRIHLHQAKLYGLQFD